jgi:16S rRNA (guanine527-N7)-methyltransferase
MEKLIKFTREIVGIQLSTDQVNSFRVFEDELIYYNNQFNLTAIRDPESIRIKHFLDSLTCLLAMDLHKRPESLIDVGTGAGFPGIALKIIMPRMRLTMVESVHKKARFCEHIAAKLGLENVTVISERAEDVGQSVEHRQAYDIAVARAVAATSVLAEYLLPLVKLGGAAIMQKGESAHVEVQAANKAFEILGGRLRQVIPVLLPGVVEERFLVVVDKVAVTSNAYPRKAGIPTKHPLGG